jgi:hypothetical protein
MSKLVLRFHVNNEHLCCPHLAETSNLGLQRGSSLPVGPVPVAGEAPFLKGHPSRELV